MKKIIIVAGGRTYSNRERMTQILLEENPSFVIEGKAPGADTLAGKVCELLDIDYAEVPALWGIRRNAAGPRRNRVMAKMLLLLGVDAEIKLIAFPGKVGTLDMVSVAEKLKIPVRKVDW